MVGHKKAVVRRSTTVCVSAGMGSNAIFLSIISQSSVSSNVLQKLLIFIILSPEVKEITINSEFDSL